MVLTMETLVPCGVSVLCDGRAVGLRLGSNEAMPQAKAIPISMRHPSHDCAGAVPDAVSWSFPANAFAGNQASYGAGRSLGHAGVLVRRSPAILAGRTRPCGRSRVTGGPSLTAAARLCLTQDKPSATVAGKTSSRRTLPSYPFAPHGAERREETRTPTAASTRGRV